jgi:hypothetical protein
LERELSKIDEIYDAILPEIEKAGYEDTTENRIQALTGLRDAWMEDFELEAVLWIMAVNSEIFKLELELLFGRR